MRHRGALLGSICIALATGAGAAAIDVHTLGASGVAAPEACERCADGDTLIHNGALEIVIGGSHRRDESFYRFPTADALGSIVFLRPARTSLRGDIMVGTPTVRVGNTTRHVQYADLQLERSGSDLALVASGPYSDDTGVRARFSTRYLFAAGSSRVRISLTLENAGSKPIEDFIYAIFFDPHQIYDFSPADVEPHHSMSFRGYPRENHLIGWLDATPRLSVGEERYGWDGGMILADPVAIDLAPGERVSRQYTLVTDADRDALERLYEEVGVASEKVSFEFVSASRDAFEVVVRDADTSAIFFRSFLDRPAPLEIALPVGRYTVRANFFPGVAECSLRVTEGSTNTCRLQDPPQGRETLRIVDSAGEFVPGKVSFRGLDGTPTPYFRPQNPTRDDGYWESHKNSAFPEKAGSTIAVPIGRYRVSASRGPEYSLDEQTVEIHAAETAELVFRIDRAIDRPDLVSIDPHLHTLESDGAVDVAQKIRAIVAEGVDVAIATDHNFPVDYRPALAKLGLEDELTVFTGAEVTVPERLDYNTYPMTVQSERPNHGAIDALSTDLTALFHASRARDRGVVVQVNHPRSWQFDYFNWHDLDPESAAFASEGFDLSFDVLEVVNGADYDTPNNRAARRDWFNLLRRGYFFPLVGSSDSHEIDRDEPGYSRTYVDRGDSPRAPLDAEWLMRTVREGRSFASNGPILDLRVFDRYRPGDTLTAVNREVSVAIDVWTAPWIEASSVALYVNGEPQSVPMRSIPHATAHHQRAEIELRLDHDAFLVAELRGARDLSPVVQPRSGADGSEVGVLPYALTNPIFVDVDGNARFDAPLPHAIQIRAIDRMKETPTRSTALDDST